MTDEHLRRSIRAMSSFGYGSAMILFGAALYAFTFLTLPENPLLRHGAGLLMLVVAAVSVLLGHGLRYYRPWARRGAIIISVAGLLAVPLGTFLCGPFLYVLIKSKHLFASEPQSHIALPVSHPQEKPSHPAIVASSLRSS